MRNLFLPFISVNLLQDAYPAALSLSHTHPPKKDSGKKVRLKSSWVKIKTGTSLTNYDHGQNRLDLGKINLSPIKIG